MVSKNRTQYVLGRCLSIVHRFRGWCFAVQPLKREQRPPWRNDNSLWQIRTPRGNGRTVPTTDVPSDGRLRSSGERMWEMRDRSLALCRQVHEWVYQSLLWLMWCWGRRHMRRCALGYARRGLWCSLLLLGLRLLL